MEAKNLILCPRCSYWTAKDKTFCWKCGKTLPISSFNSADEEEDVDTVIAPEEHALLRFTLPATTNLEAGVWHRLYLQAHLA